MEKLLFYFFGNDPLQEVSPYDTKVRPIQNAPIQKRPIQK